MKENFTLQRLDGAAWVDVFTGDVCEAIDRFATMLADRRRIVDRRGQVQMDDGADRRVGFVHMPLSSLTAR